MEMAVHSLVRCEVHSVLSVTDNRSQDSVVSVVTGLQAMEL